MPTQRGANRDRTVMKQKTAEEETSARWVAAMVRMSKEMALTQAQLAAVIGMSKDAVASWETGRNRMRAMSALKISARLKRNIVAGKTDPITVAELVEPRVQEYERSLRRRLGV